VVAIVAGVALFGWRGSDSFGVDFTTGTNMIVRIDNQGAVNVGDVRSNLDASGFHSSVVTEYGDAGSNTFLIRLGETPEQADTQEGETVSDAALRSLAALAGGEANLDVEKVDTIGPAVGAKLKRDALLSVTYSLFFIILYLWFRFELKFAVAAVAAVFHDVLFTVGAFALMGTLFGGYQISLDVVAAILTIIGYSLNDTIVIFDRVREDVKLYRGRDLSYIEILNLSMNHTLSRTILTSLTTLFVVLILFVFGGAVIRDFAFALIVGILVGTYSTICIASPIVYYWDRWQNLRRAAKASDEAAARGRRTGTKSTKNKKGSETESTA
jgi:preprotein translocase SecF subunit